MARNNRVNTSKKQKNMKEFLIALFIVVLVIAITYFFLNKNKKDVVKPFDDCTNKNKGLPEGSACTSCIPEGSTETPFTGTIVNGVCTKVQPPPPPPPTSDTLKVSNTGGARVYLYYNNPAGAIFVPQNKWIPFDTKTTYNKTITTPLGASYYNTPFGWLSALDMTILNTSS